MKTASWIAPLLLAASALVVSGTSHSAEGAASDVIARLGATSHTLLKGIEQAEKGGGDAISAKFEVEDGKLWLSVYTAKDGLKPDAEHNTLMELKGEATTGDWQPATEVFQDKAHIARSATHLTVLQSARSNLKEAIRKASAVQSGTVYSAIPLVKNGRPAVAVAVAAAGDKKVLLTVDLLSSKVERN
jgi:hypothetical protein